jgi:hypothetical protein
MTKLSKLIIPLTLIVFFACTKEESVYPKKYKVVEFTESRVDLYTIDGIIENHSYTFDSINKREFFESFLINEIIFTAKNIASFKFPVSEEQELWELMGKNLNVTYNNDSIFFSKELIVDDYDLSSDFRGLFKNDNIYLNGIFFEYSDEYTYFWGMDYHPFSIEKALEYIWNESSKDLATMRIYHFELEFGEVSK